MYIERNRLFPLYWGRYKYRDTFLVCGNGVDKKDSRYQPRIVEHVDDSRRASYRSIVFHGSNRASVDSSCGMDAWGIGGDDCVRFSWEIFLGVARNALCRFGGCCRLFLADR